MKPKLVIVNSAQFGYHIDTYYYCKYLKKQYDISYICWYHGKPKVDMSAVKVHYIERNGGVARVYRFLRQFLRITHSSHTIIFIKYFKILSTVIFMFRSKNPMVLDIRSGSVSLSRIRRFFDDALLKFESIFFKNITIISSNLAERLRFNKKVKILPLGADTISIDIKKFNELKLLYVGTLYNRRLEMAIEGFAQFYRNKKSKCNIEFTIIGSGPGNEIAEIKNVSVKEGVNCVVKVIGSIPHDKLKPYFDTHNIGISYIPITAYYDAQPSTKTFEYLLSGMPVLATSTSENKLVIDETNGVLIDDTPDGVSKGLSKIYEKRFFYDSASIRKNSMRFYWKDIVSTLEQYLQTL